PGRVGSVRGHDHRATGLGHAHLTVDRERELAFDDVPYLFLRMVVLVKGDRVLGDLVDPERHVVGVEETPLPARERSLNRISSESTNGMPKMIARQSRTSTILPSLPPASNRS